MAFPFEELLQRAEADLACYEEAAIRHPFPKLGIAATHFELITKTLEQPFRIYEPTQVSNQKEKISPTLGFVLAVLMNHFNNQKLYAYPTKEQMEQLTGVTDKTLRKAITGLRAAGLLGVISGKRQTATRYYFLIHDGSRQKFQLAIEELRELKEIPSFEIENHSGILDGDPENTPF